MASLARGGFCITLVGATDVEAAAFKGALGRVLNSESVELVTVSDVAAGTYPPAKVHAIVLLPSSAAGMSPADIDALKTASAPGTCRVYLLMSDGSAPGAWKPALDNFIQRTPSHDGDAVVSEIMTFFVQADSLNRRNMVLGMRDQLCIAMYNVLKLAWPIGAIVATFHIANRAAVLVRAVPLLKELPHPALVPLATFFGAFFVVHCVTAVSRNYLYANRIVRNVDSGFMVRAIFFVAAAVLTVQGMAIVDHSSWSNGICASLAVLVYAYYSYCLRIRAECSSISFLQTAISDPRHRGDLLTRVGSAPLRSTAFPFLARRPEPVFISYMHGSAWSTKVADRIHRSIGKDFEVFLDRSSLPPGGLWRQQLLRAASECGTFIAVLDDEHDATDWVLTESAYANLVRKSIGKPRILIVVRSASGLVSLQHGPFGQVYEDVFGVPPDCRYAAGFLSAGESGPRREEILGALSAIRPMSLL